MTFEHELIILLAIVGGSCLIVNFRTVTGFAGNWIKYLKPSPQREKKITGRGSTAPALESRNPKHANRYAPLDPMTQRGNGLLERMEHLSSENISVEDRHNLEVLRAHTDQLLQDYMQASASTMSLKSFQEAVTAQLDELDNGLNTLEARAAQEAIRELDKGTEFLKMKFPEKVETPERVKAAEPAPQRKISTTKTTKTPGTSSSIDESLLRAEKQIHFAKILMNRQEQEMQRYIEKMDAIYQSLDGK